MHVWLNCPGYTQIYRVKGSDRLKTCSIPLEVAVGTEEQFLTWVWYLRLPLPKSRWKVGGKKTSTTLLWLADGLLIIP